MDNNVYESFSGTVYVNKVIKLNEYNYILCLNENKSSDKMIGFIHDFTDSLLLKCNIKPSDKISVQDKYSTYKEHFEKVDLANSYVIATFGYNPTYRNFSILSMTKLYGNMTKKKNNRDLPLSLFPLSKKKITSRILNIIDDDI